MSPQFWECDDMKKTATEPEVRCLNATEIRASGDDEGDGLPDIIGYAALFNDLSEDLGGFRERIAPGAFAQTLHDADDVRALIDHDPSKILGRSKAGTLDLAEDSRGLKVRIMPPDTQLARDLIKSIERGDVSQMSFRFITRSDTWDEMNGDIIRTLTNVLLMDVSAVTFPAYERTDVSIAKRSMSDWRSCSKAKICEMDRRLRLTEVE